MGKSIVYCGGCGKSLREDDFDKGRARLIDNRPYCVDCRAAEAPTPKPALSSSSTRMRSTNTPRPMKASGSAPRPHRVWIVAIVVGLVAVASILAMVLTSSSPPPIPEPPPPARPDDTEARQAVEVLEKLAASSPDPEALLRECDRTRPLIAGTRYEERWRRVETQGKDRLVGVTGDAAVAELRQLIEGDPEFKKAELIERKAAVAIRVAPTRKSDIDALRSDYAARRARGGLDESLIGRWKLDEASGDVATDASGHTHAGKLHGGPSRVAGKAGGALHFNGVDQYVELPSAPDLDKVQSADYTLSAWFRPDDIPPGKAKENNAAYGILIKPGTHTGIRYGPGDQFVQEHWLAKPPGWTGAGTWANHYPPGVFYHVVAMRNRKKSTVEIYVDGALRGSAASPGQTPAFEYGKRPWRIGIGAPGAPNYAWPCKGTIDDVRIYSRALTPAEIESLFKSAASD